MEHALTGATEPADGGSHGAFFPGARTGLCITVPASLSVRSECAGTRIVRCLFWFFFFSFFLLRASTERFAILATISLFPARSAVRNGRDAVTARNTGCRKIHAPWLANLPSYRRLFFCVSSMPGPIQGQCRTSHFTPHCVRRTVGRPFFVTMEGWWRRHHLRASFGPAVFAVFR